MIEDEKKRLVLLINHWIKHNLAHTENYLDKAKKLEHQKFGKVAKHMEDASDFVLQANKEFEAAIKILDGL